MDPDIVKALLSDETLKTAEDADAAGRITARAYADEWKRLDGIFKGADHAFGEEETEEEETGEDENKAAGPVTPEDLAWLVQNLGV